MILKSYISRAELYWVGYDASGASYILDSAVVWEYDKEKKLVTFDPKAYRFGDDVTAKYTFDSEIAPLVMSCDFFGGSK